MNIHIILGVLMVAVLVSACASQAPPQAEDNSAELAGLDEVDQTLSELDTLDEELNLAELDSLDEDLNFE